MSYWYKNRQINQLNRTQYSEIILCVYICKVYSQGCQDTQKGKDRLHWSDSQILPAVVHTNTWHPRAVSLPWLTESRQRIQIGPKHSLLPNSTETPFPSRGWEALPWTAPRGASSQGPGHRVMGRWDLSGDDRAEGRPRVSVHVQESHRTLQSQTRLASPEKGISGRID